MPQKLEYPFDTPEFNRRYFVKPVGALDTVRILFPQDKLMLIVYFMSTAILAVLIMGLAEGCVERLQDKAIGVPQFSNIIGY